MEPVTATVTTAINQADVQIHKTDGRATAQPGDTITYTLTYTNAGPGIAHNTVLTDTLPPTAIEVRTPTIPGVITPTIDLAQHRIVIQLGTLQPGQVGRTTVTLRVAPNTPTGGAFVNTVDIDTTSSETNENNNRSTDVDRLPSPTAVVLAEFRAVRQAGGVMVEWRTVAEQDNYGFRIYRSHKPIRDGAVLITPNIIPGQGRGRADGASYSFLDPGAPDEPLYYWLEDIDLNGVSTFHGPAMTNMWAAQFNQFVPFVVR